MRRTVPLTPAEFELMEVLWEMGEASVRQVWDRVRAQRQVAYTTVMTVLDKMRRKGVLAQRRRGKAYFYSPLINRDGALELVVQQVVEAYFKGSPSEMRRFLDRGAPSPPPDVKPAGPSPRKPDSAMDEFLL